jgi:RNA polymerase sigma factor (sigma-70 family)
VERARLRQATNPRLRGWEQLYRDESPRLWRAIFAYAGDRDVASDAVAEAFTQAISRGSAIDDPASWIWTTSFKVAAGELKRRSSIRQHVDTGDEYEAAEPLLPVLIEALMRLSPSQRAVVVLHDYADRPTNEIAQTLDMKLPTIHVHLSQGRKRLRDYLGVHDEQTAE